MLGRTIYRNRDRETTADLFAALTCRYPTKGLALERDGDVHLIKAGGDSCVVEAFVAGMQWQHKRAAKLDGWINANAQKPTTVDDVLIWREEGCPDVGYYSYADLQWKSSDGVTIGVTHWQPLAMPREVAAMTALCGDEACDSNRGA